MMEDIIRIDEASKITGYTIGTIRNKVWNNSIPYYKTSGRVRFRKSELIKWMLGERKGGRK